MKYRINAWVNTHKYEVTVTAVAVVSLLILRHQSKTNLLTVTNKSNGLVMLPPQWSNKLDTNENVYAYIKAA